MLAPSVVKETYNNATYLLRELNGIQLKVPFVGKWVKLFRRRGEYYEDDNENVQKNEEYDGFGHKGNQSEFGKDPLAHIGGCASLEGVDLVDNCLDLIVQENFKLQNYLWR